MLLYLLLIVAIATAHPSGTRLRVNTGDGLNVRVSPCTNARIITTLGNGVVVTSTGNTKTDCGYHWVQVKGGFATGWAASKFFVVVRGYDRVYGPGINGLRDVLMQKLQELAVLVGSRVRVHSGCRQGGSRSHAECRAADFHVDGQSDVAVYRKALAQRGRFRGFQFIYHTPGRRSCSTGEHNHVAYDGKVNQFCYERTCNWAKECSYVSKNNKKVMFEFKETPTCKDFGNIDCWAEKEEISK
eukprot:gene6963-11125_t